MVPLIALLFYFLVQPSFGATTFLIEYADRENVPIICAVRGGSVEVRRDMAGCHILKGGEHRIVIPFGSKYSCVYWHEVRHVFEGNWHPGREASEVEGCNWRPPGWVE